MSLRSLLSLRVALITGLAIHLDWHLARPTHHRLSLGWPLHWLFAIPVFFATGWYAARRWPAAPWTPAFLSMGLGVLLGQVAEPVGEVLFFGSTLVQAFARDRLLAFGAFLSAGLLTLVTTIIAARRDRRPSGSRPKHRRAGGHEPTRRRQ